jgi:hypothetical protein
MTRNVDAQFSQGIALQGYTIESGAQGETGTPNKGPFKITLYWTLRSRPDIVQASAEHSYTVFVQLLDRDGKLVSQHDGVPGNGQLPTTAWISDDLVVDPHILPSPTGAQDGPFTLIVGLYDSETIQRLTTIDGADYVKLTELVGVNR